MQEPSSKSHLTSVDALLLFTVLIWGVNFSVVKFGLAEIPPLAFNSIRFMAVVVTMVIAARAWGTRWQFQRKHLPYLIGLGLLGNPIYQVLFIYGADLTTADNAALILSTVPVWVALVGSLVGMERVTSTGWLGVGLSFFGITLIILGGDRAAEFHFGGATLAGDVLVLIATLCWSAYTLLVRLAVRHYGSMSVTTFCTLMGAGPLILFGVPELAALDVQQVSIGAWLSAILSGVFAVGVAYFLWNYGISKLGSTRTSLYSNLVPAFALVTAWLWLGETLTPQQGWGALLAVAGVALARGHTQPRESS